jgi:sugar/nucleoside kinase (ribokinase family)
MEAPERFDAVVAGYLGVDLTPAFPPSDAPVPLAQLLRPGKLTEVGPLAVSPGGVVANTGLAMAALGSRVALMGLVGTDALGDMVLGLLEGRGATLKLARTDAAGTAYGIVLAPPQTDRMFLEYPGCNATFTASDLDYEVIGASRLFHFGYPPLMEAFLAHDGAELEAMFSRVRGLGVATSLDMTLPDPHGSSGRVDWRRLLSRVLPYVDIFVPSIEELLYMLAPEQWQSLTATADGRDMVDLVPDHLYQALASDATALGASIVLIKAGHRGGYCRTGSVAELLTNTRLSITAESFTDREVWLEGLPADPAKVKNACGAGDAAVAGFLSALLRGSTLGEAGRAAMLAGRNSLYGVDTTSGLSG